MAVEWIAIGMAGLSLLVSIFLSVRYGDVAGASKIIKEDKRKAHEASVTALRALLNEVSRIGRLAEHNSKLDNKRRCYNRA